MESRIANVAVVSHGHFEILKRLNCLPKLVEHHEIQVFVLDNVGEVGLEAWCREKSITYLKNSVKRGFGENNNLVFSSAPKADFFVVMNPDVDISKEVLIDFLDILERDGNKVGAANLFLDHEMSVFDPSVRRFPHFLDFVRSYIGLPNRSILDKSLIKEPIPVDWASASFLVFVSDLYEEIGGFDPSYFMYCEDIDICLRVERDSGCQVWYYPNVKLVHQAAHKNRRLFSKHFYWHICGVVRYLLTKYGIRKGRGGLVGTNRHMGNTA